MRGLEKLTYVRLADALTQSGAVQQDQLTPLLEECDQNKSPLPELVVRTSIVSEWDLLQTVSEQFNLPFIFPSQYDLDKALINSLDAKFLQDHNIIPMSRFGDVLTVIMPILTPYDVLEELERMSGAEVFPFVGLISENTRALLNAIQTKKNDTNEWESLFDEADATVQKDQD